jgi:hypothetical protein
LRHTIPESVLRNIRSVDFRVDLAN